MTTKRIALIALILLSTVIIGACGSDQQADDQQPSSANRSAATSTVAQEYHATVKLAGIPAISADGKSILVTVTVANTGDSTFGTVISPSVNVNLGAHSIDASGRIVDQDLARGTLPHIAPGTSASAIILLPVDKVLNKSVQILPVEENVAWFDKWGNKPLTVGPFNSCSNSAAGTVCDAADKPLPTASSQP